MPQFTPDLAVELSVTSLYCTRCQLECELSPEGMKRDPVPDFIARHVLSTCAQFELQGELKLPDDRIVEFEMAITVPPK